MSLKEKINYEMVFPKEILKEANEIFKELPVGLKSILRHHLIIEKLERQRLWKLFEEIKSLTLKIDADYDYNAMDEMDALQHFQDYHTKLMSIINKEVR